MQICMKFLVDEVRQREMYEGLLCGQLRDR